jgi:hypothetical protein
VEQNPLKIKKIKLFYFKNKIFFFFTFVGSLKSGKSRKSTAVKPSAIQITNPSNKKHHEYLTTNVEYL